MPGRSSRGRKGRIHEPLGKISIQEEIFTHVVGEEDVDVWGTAASFGALLLGDDGADAPA